MNASIYAAVAEVRAAMEPLFRAVDGLAASVPKVAVEDPTCDDDDIEHLWRLLDRRAEQLASARQQVIALSRENARLRSKLIENGITP